MQKPRFLAALGMTNRWVTNHFDNFYGEKTGTCEWMMPGGRIPTAGSQGMTLTQGAYMLLTFCPTQNQT
jgi:hypothetical protein